MPLITTLIPAYKPRYLDEVFLGLQHQSVRDFEVIVSDDSPGGEITQLIEHGRLKELVRGLRVQVVPGPRHARLNHQALIGLWAGRSPLVHFHLDDDLVYPDFYRAHVEAHATGRFAASVSRRWMSRGSSLPTQGFELPASVAASPARRVDIDAASLFATTVPTCANWLGELTNMVFSAEGARHYPTPPTETLNYYGWLDIGWLLEAGRSLPLVLLREHLSVFRHHAEQTTHNVHHHGGRVSSMAWAAYALAAWHEQRITDQQAVQAVCQTVGQCMQTFGDDDPVMNQFFDIVQHQGTSLGRLHAAFSGFWFQLLASDRSTAARAAHAATQPTAIAPALAV